MNCKQGDMAVVALIWREEDTWMLGRIVRCEQFKPTIYGEPAWLTDPLIGPDGKRWTLARDECLRPIRDQDGDDETLAWKDVPVLDDATQPTSVSSQNPAPCATE